MSAFPNLSNSPSPQEDDLLDDLRDTLGKVQSEQYLSRRIRRLSRVIRGLFRFPAVTTPSTHQQSNCFEASLLGLLEEGLDCIAKGFQAALEQSWRNMHRLNLQGLKFSGRSFLVDRQIERCLAYLRRFERYWSASDEYTAVDCMLTALTEFAVRFEEPPKKLGIPQRQWFFDFVLFLLAQVAMRISSRFGNWEVMMLNQTVPGTGVAAVVERPSERIDVLETHEEVMST